MKLTKAEPSIFADDLTKVHNEMPGDTIVGTWVALVLGMILTLVLIIIKFRMMSIKRA